MGVPQKQAQSPGEAPQLTKYFRKWKGIYTASSRVAIPEDHFYDLVNLIPIGDGNLRSIPNISASLVDYGADSIYWAQYANINSTDYLISFATNGKVFAYNIGAGTSSQINAGKIFSGAGSRMDQWKNERIVFIDSTGFYNWDGTTFTGPSGATGILPAPTYTAPDIAVFSGRVWIYINRLLYITELNTYNGFVLANGALIQNLTDPQLRGQVTRLYSANGYLYLLGKSSVFVISDVYIPSGASPPAPSFSILNVQALIGCDQPASVFPFNRDLMFANTYGLWKLSGVTAQKISDDIDGTLQYLDTSFAISGGSPRVANILQTSFLFKQSNDPIAGTRTIVASYFNDKWWFANYGALTFVATGISSNQPVLFGFLGNKLYQLFQDTTIGPATSWKTALWPMEDQLCDKEVFRVGFEMTVRQAGLSLSLSVDTPNISTPVLTTTNVGNVMWSNNSASIVQWKNNALSIVTWYSTAFLLNLADGQGAFGKYVGITCAVGTGAIYELNSQMMDYALKKRW
jgi:hypothetical protein